MGVKYELPEAVFADQFIAGNSLNADYLNTATGFVTAQFNLNEDIRNYANAVEQSAQLIGLDVDRQVAVEVAGIQVQVARDKAAYKSQLADSVKEVRIQQAHLEGNFGIDLATVKSAADLTGIAVTAALQEESTTTLSSREAASIVTLAAEDESSNSLVTTRESVFRRGLADIDYDAAVSIADSRKLSILSKGLLDQQTAIVEGSIADTGMAIAYQLEAEGLSRMGSIDVGYIRSSGIAETSHKIQMSDVRVQSALEIGTAESMLYDSEANIKLQQYAAEQNAQIAADLSVSDSQITYIRTSGALDIEYDRVSANAADEMYLAGARADMAIEQARYKAEVKGIGDLAQMMYGFTQEKTLAEMGIKLQTAIIEGQGVIARAVTEGKNDVEVSLEKASQMRRLGALRLKSIKDTATEHARNTANLSTIVVGQIGADSAEAVRFQAADTLLKVRNYANMLTVESEAATAETITSITHAQNMQTQRINTATAKAGMQASYLIDKAAVAGRISMNRMVEESAYITASAAQEATKIATLSADNTGHISASAQQTYTAVRGIADAAYNAAVTLADAQAQLAINFAIAASTAEIAYKAWEDEVNGTTNASLSSYSTATASIQAYGIAYMNSIEMESIDGPTRVLTSVVEVDDPGAYTILREPFSDIIKSI